NVAVLVHPLVDLARLRAGGGQQRAGQQGEREKLAHHRITFLLVDTVLLSILAQPLQRGGVAGIAFEKTDQVRKLRDAGDPQAVILLHLLHRGELARTALLAVERRSEERRVGKGWRSRRSAGQYRTRTQ